MGVSPSWDSASALVPRLDGDCLPRQYFGSEKQPEDLPKNQFFGQQRYRQGKDQPTYNCHECDCHLHDRPPIPPRTQFHTAVAEPRLMSLNGMALGPENPGRSVV